MDDPEHEKNVIVLDEVVHHAIVADTEAVERVRLAPDRLHLLATDATTPDGCLCELLKTGADSLSLGSRELFVGALGRRREPYLVGVAQPRSSSGVERPRR